MKRPLLNVHRSVDHGGNVAHLNEVVEQRTDNVEAGTILTAVR